MVDSQSRPTSSGSSYTAPYKPAPTSPRFSTDPSSTTRPLPFFHPTRAELTAHRDSTDGSSQDPSHWSSRASRKNRHPRRSVKVRHKREGNEDIEAGSGGVTGGTPADDEFVDVQQRFRHASTKLKLHPTWGISFWVGIMFLLGSSAWIANGFLLYLPLLNLVTNNITAASWLAFAGGTLFEIGGYLMYVESLNTGHDELFAPALWGLVGAQGVGGVDAEKAEVGGDDKEKERKAKFRWFGWNSWRDIGFLASFIQMCAASIFWVSTITGLPNVIANLSTSPNVAIADVFYWTPQVIGGTGFIIASTLYMLEEQRSWWRLAPRSLGWQVGFWNLIGGIGFTMCGALGYASLVSTKVEYQSVMSTFWGSFAFMIGSVIQFWEAIWRE